MKFYTFQPRAVLKDILSGCYKVNRLERRSRLNNIVKSKFVPKYSYNPIFCRPYENAFNAWADCFWLSPSYPECVIIFESDVYDSVTMNSMCDCLARNDAILSDTKGVEPREYFVPEIRKDQLLMVRPLVNDDTNLPIGICYMNYILSGLFYIELCEFFKEDCMLENTINHTTLHLINNYVLNTDICRNLMFYKDICPGDIEIIRSRVYDCINCREPLILKHLILEES